MSDPNRRHGDHRMDKLESTVEKMRDDITDIKAKIYNGFEKSIKSTESKVNYIDERNREDHKALIEKVSRLSGKFDKMLWSLVGISFILIAGKIVEHFI